MLGEVSTICDWCGLLLEEVSTFCDDFSEFGGVIGVLTALVKVDGDEIIGFKVETTYWIIGLLSGSPSQHSKLIKNWIKFQYKQTNKYIIL